MYDDIELLFLPWCDCQNIIFKKNLTNHAMKTSYRFVVRTYLGVRIYFRNIHYYKIRTYVCICMKEYRNDFCTIIYIFYILYPMYVHRNTDVYRKKFRHLICRFGCHICGVDRGSSWWCCCFCGGGHTFSCIGRCVCRPRCSGIGQSRPSTAKFLQGGRDKLFRKENVLPEETSHPLVIGLFERLWDYQILQLGLVVFIYYAYPCRTRVVYQRVCWRSCWDTLSRLYWECAPTFCMGHQEWLGVVIPQYLQDVDKCSNYWLVPQTYWG